MIEVQTSNTTALVVLLLLRERSSAMRYGAIVPNDGCELFAARWEALGPGKTLFCSPGVQLTGPLTRRFLEAACRFSAAWLPARRSELVNKVVRAVRKTPTMIAVGLIMFYRMAISPVLPPACRFVPTCSEYGLIAFKRYGFRKGFVLTAKRILKCRPGGPCGYDPVP